MLKWTRMQKKHGQELQRVVLIWIPKLWRQYRGLKRA